MSGRAKQTRSGDRRCDTSCGLCRVVGSIATLVLVSVAIARTILPRAFRALARYASPELFQLATIAFCLVCGWATGRMVRHFPPKSFFSPL